MNFIDYIDRVSIIHLPDRIDRYRQISRELTQIGVSIDHPKLEIPEAPMPGDANGFRSRGVYGSFLSHLDILEKADRDGVNTVLTLEDDAIFSYRFTQVQDQLVDELQSNQWDLCFLGHPLKLKNNGSSRILVTTSESFKWAHCYIVHRRIRSRLVSYLKETIRRPVGHPEGGKMYIDGAYSLFRRLNPEVVTLIAAPALSVQRGSPSSLANRRWYDKNPLTAQLANGARAIRDDVWRRGWLA